MRSGSVLPYAQVRSVQRRALVEAVQRIGRLDLHLVEQLEARLVLDDEREVLASRGGSAWG